MKLITNKRASKLFMNAVKKEYWRQCPHSSGKLKAGLLALCYAVDKIEEQLGSAYEIAFHEDNIGNGDGLHYINFGSHKDSCISFDTRTGIFRWQSIDEIKKHLTFRYGIKYKDVRVAANNKGY